MEKYISTILKAVTGQNVIKTYYQIANLQIPTMQVLFVAMKRVFVVVKNYRGYMKLLLIFILTISSNAFSIEKKEILFLTDSHGLSTFGEVVDSSLRNIEGANVTTWAVGGTAPWQWINPKTRWKSGAGFHDKGNYLKAPKMRKGNIKPTRTPHIDDILKGLSGQGQKIALIVQGSNHDHSDWGLNFLERNSKILSQKLIDAGFQCYWVGPPKMRRFENNGPEYTKEIVRRLKRAVSNQCKFFDSYPVTFYPKGGDGVHYSGTKAHKKEARKWAAKVIFDFKTFFSLDPKVKLNWDPFTPVNLNWLVQSMKPLSISKREELILKKLIGGSASVKSRQLVPVSYEKKLSDGKIHQVTFYVTADYLSLGGEHNFLRTPINLLTVRNILQSLNAIIPTKLMVDKIYNRSTVKLSPRPMKPGPNMNSVEYFVNHNSYISNELDCYDYELLGGVKKDVVLSKKLIEEKEKIAIYGWHQLNGKPIQPLSTIHIDRYVDYSHGVRLVARDVKVDGRWRSFREVLLDELLSELVSEEGPFDYQDIL